MKRLTTSLLAASLLLFAASCGQDKESETSTSDTTMMTAPAMEPTAPTTGPTDMVADSMAGGAATTNDNTGGGISTGNPSSGTSSSRASGRRKGTSNADDGTTGVPSSQAAPPDQGGSTYKRAQPGDPVDGRMPVGSSR